VLPAHETHYIFKLNERDVVFKPGFNNHKSLLVFEHFSYPKLTEYDKIESGHKKAQWKVDLARDCMHKMGRFVIEVNKAESRRLQMLWDNSVKQD
jgi:hypothetical protein